MSLIEKLIKEGYLDREKATAVETEAEEKSRTKEEILLEHDIISEEELFNLKSEVLGIPIKNDISEEEISRDTLSLIPQESVDYYKIVPLKRDEEKMEVGMVYPENLRAKEVLRFIAKKEDISYEVFLISFDNFRKIREKYNTATEKIYSSLLKELVKRDILEEEVATSIEQESENKKESVEEIILRKNIITEDELFDIKSSVIEVPFKKEIKVEDISHDLISLINEDSANYYKMIPVGRKGDKVEIGMVYPENLRAQEALKFISRRDIFSYNIYLIKLSTFEKIRSKNREIAKDFGASLMNKLEDNGFLKKEQIDFLEKEAEKNDKKREEVLLEHNIIPENDLFKIKSEIVGVPYRNNIETEKIDEGILNIFSKDAFSYYKMAPIGRTENEIEVGMVYPESKRAKEALDLIAKQENFSYKVFLISLSDFKNIKKRYGIIAREKKSDLLEKLIEKDLINAETAAQVEKESNETEKTKEEVLIEKNIVSEEEVFSAKSEILSIPFKSNITASDIEEDLLRLIPEDSANHYKMVPIKRDEDTVEIGMVYPENLRAQEALKFLSRRGGFAHLSSLISLSTFKEISKQYRTITKEVGAALEDIDMEIEEDEDAEKVDMDTDIGRLAEEAPIVKVVAVILRNAIDGRASDIHIEPSREKLKVRFRVDGILYSSLYLPMAIHLAVIARIKILAGLKIDEQRLPQDGRFSTKVAKKNIDFRVSTFPTTLGEKIVIRVLDPDEGLKDIKELGVMERNFQILNRSIKRPTGMTLAVGPTGSGKSTTLYAILKLLNDERSNIVTLEDPVEYFIDGVSQSQIHTEIGYVFAKGLRQILRQDPDIIMVGEIRDDETADLAIHAALTGHVVLSTLHTNNAMGVIPRLIDMGIKPFLIPPAINTMMSQRLVRKICDKCKRQIEPSEEIKALIMDELKDIPEDVLASFDIPSPLKIYRADGCKNCSEEGLEGRMGIYEVFSMTRDLGEIIMRDPTEKELLAEAVRQGMITIKQDGIIKVLKGYTTIEEVLRATEER